jgi:hypothetical protein
MPSQRPYFLSSFIAAFRQQSPSIQASSQQQPSKHTTQASSSTTTTNNHHASASPSSSRTISAAAAAAASQHNQHHHHQSSSMAVHSPRSTPSTSAVPIPNASSNRRRGSDSSSEGFRDAIGADKWYIGGRTATGEEKFFKLGVIKRVKSNDGLSLDRLSL